MSTGGNLEKLREELANLRRQYTMQRLKMSQTIPEIIGFCHDNAEADALLTPTKDNPFKAKKRCALI